MNTFQGWATPLGQVVHTTGVTGAPNLVSGPFPGVSCSVFNPGSLGVYATIFSSSGGAFPNPFQVESDGAFSFQGPLASYDLLFSTLVPAVVAVPEVLLPNYPKAALPSTSALLAGRLAKLTDTDLGAWMDTGAQWFSLSGQVYNVKAFGAVGDGVTDDTASIQAAFDAATAAINATVLFPPGVYLAKTALTIGSFSHVSSLSIIGDGAEITTPLNVNTGGVTSIFLTLQGYCTNTLIEGINFTNTHGLTAGDTVCLYLSGGSNNGLQFTTIRNCTFKNWSNAILNQGQDTRITGNYFLSTLGHDSGTQGSTPNVGIRSAVNANGRAARTMIVDNYFNGATADTVAANTIKRALDGLVHGTSDGWNVSGNVIVNHDVEAIFIAARAATDYPSTDSVVVSHNAVRSTRVAGTVGDNSYGIRVDESNSVISGNSITGAARGVLIYGPDYVVRPENFTISGNQITMAESPLLSEFGIRTTTVNRGLISGNHVQWFTPASSGATLDGIGVDGTTDKVVVVGNTVDVQTLVGGLTVRGLVFGVDPLTSVVAALNILQQVDTKVSGTPTVAFGNLLQTQTVLATGAGHSVDDVITALQNLGLVKQA